MTTPESIKRLVQRFEENKESYSSGKYNGMQLKCEIESTDRRIDDLVYELYGLTEEEIPIVEGR